MTLTLLGFRLQFARCFPKTWPNRILVALSGGVDSMCLTHLISQVSAQAPGTQIFAATIDHAYRSNSALEAMAVGSIVRKWGVRHIVARLQYDTDPTKIQNFEEVARALRYKSLQDVCLAQDISHVFVAHTQDDLLETYLQRLLMNSTMYGLVGLNVTAPFPVPPKSPTEHIQVHRPLLSFSKTAIRDYCEDAGVEWFEDVSNSDTQLTQRNKLRYMINDYVPSIMSIRPEANFVSREKLLESTKEIQLLVAGYEKQKKTLDMYVKLHDYEFRKESCTFKFCVPLSFLTQFEESAVARWLYELVYPISSSKHYHWSYAKIERQAMRKLRIFLDGLEPSAKFNYIGVCMSMEKKDDKLHFLIEKQPPMRENLAKGVPVTNEWTLFDRTWWIRCRSPQPLYLFWYTDEMKQELLTAFPDLKRGKDSLRARIGTVPILRNAESQIVGLPTHKLYADGIEGECILKGHEN